jgi:hypothetical protein
MHSIVRFTFLCLLCVTDFASCRSQQKSVGTYTSRQLIFGSGGGFSGQVIEYILQENGQLSRSNSLSEENKVLGTLPQKEVQRYFEQAQQLKLSALNFKHPGNMYYFIRLKEGENVQEVVWGDADHQVPTQVQDLYQTLENAAQ